MKELISDEIRSWIGRSDPPVRVLVTRREIQKYAVATEQKLPKYLAGDEAPPMILFGLFREVFPLDKLGPDGLPGATLTPDLPLKRVMAGGTETEYFRPIKPGDELVATKTLTDIYEKQGKTGPLIFLVYEMKVETLDGKPVATEKQSRILR